MRIGAYQFPVTGDLTRNLDKIKHGVALACREGVQLLLLPECALTGYPPRDVPNPAAVDFRQVDGACREIAGFAASHGLFIVLGTMTRRDDHFLNSALLFTPDGERREYHKRALWGWDRDHFIPGDQEGVFDILGCKVGIRICFEVRFPEYFRQLYRARTDLNVILFYDVSDRDDDERYELIKAHIRTRAVENVCPIVTVNSSGPYQTAPTALFDRSGRVLMEMNRNEEVLLVCDWQDSPLGFGEQGRRAVSDALMGSKW